MTNQLVGIAASDGIAIGKAYLLTEPDLSFDKVSITDPEGEIKRLLDSFEKSKNEIQGIREHVAKAVGEDEAQVFDAHLMVLSDPELFDGIKNDITENMINAEAALSTVAKMYINMFESMEDNPYMQERAADIKDVTERVMGHLLGVKIPSPATINEEVVIVAKDLTPSDTAQLNRDYVKGFVTDIGGRTSHSAIMARSLEIPAVVGTKEVTQVIAEGDMVIIDGLEGDIIIRPNEETIAVYQEKAAAFKEQQLEWAKLKDSKSLSKDGKQIEIAANIGTPKDLTGVIENGAEGIGLYRTEFLYMDSEDFPTEDEQYEAYKAVLEGVNGQAVVVRTMDIGGDKELPYLQLPEEMNPFLGYRAVRISLAETEMFRTQLRALLRASVHGKLRIMFPMIATVNEFRDAKAILDEEKAKLEAEGTEVSNEIQVGIMIEIPAAAVLAHQFAKEVDFFSIGTNDLIQYTMAADRMNERVSYLYQPYNPAILTLLKHVIDSAHAEGKWVGMCGEMAGDQTAVPLLLGLGLDEFSMSASSVLKTRSLVAKLDSKEMEKLANKAINECATVEEVIALVEEMQELIK
ncbi:phosphoenolpyruvate--protein phosphotransferase [Jeotgalibaca porci]|uniref:Phosphoenolpyruvate-protein phosphotransferase n=6 Tax=Jeotgalibaca porci TaxID=1868793 RepID=A0A6G7WFP1_9LACT|nr:phosphoenolpyruvate--protein phosphotransferase [Jeotgalibaca porci]NLB98267.1 phosphoenolpyruvate--protein phosphotransferase [Lactobacillales bacterium]QIK51094.1 phosphoenolpyruvate--protein phosphotransferase [Jeotgalibaca porci]